MSYPSKTQAIESVEYLQPRTKATFVDKVRGTTITTNTFLACIFAPLVEANIMTKTNKTS